MLCVYYAMVVTMSLQVRRLAVWKSMDLPMSSNPYVKTWGYTYIVTDRMCNIMARQHNCRGYFRRDVLNIMRADACRYMALYEFGGVYADLDVELKQSFPECNGLCVGKEYPDRNTLANYVILAPRNDSCLYNAITMCCSRLRNVDINFAKDPHLVHHTCGPDAFTQACSSCAQIWSHQQLQRHVRHLIASNVWKNGYPSWIEERKQIAGWSHVYEH